jgi:hypothetical protein
MIMLIYDFSQFITDDTYDDTRLGGDIAIKNTAIYCSALSGTMEVVRVLIFKRGL